MIIIAARSMFEKSNIVWFYFFVLFEVSYGIKRQINLANYYFWQQASVHVNGILINIERVIFEIVSIACTRQGFTLTNR